MALSLLNGILEDALTHRPSRIVDQHFGCGLDLDDMLEPLTIPKMLMRGRYYRPWRSAIAKKDTGSIVSKDKDQFQVSLDVQQFAPEEITVKTVDNAIVVEGKHEEKEDEHGYVSRHFVRRYKLPDDHDIKNIKSSLSSDGVLTVSAPKRKLSDSEETVIPIEYTGPVKPLENHDRKRRRTDNK